MSQELRCPYCRNELPLALLFADPVTTTAVDRLIAIGMPMGARLTQYVMLFAAPKRALTVPRQIKLLLEVLPSIEAGKLTFKGREWQAPRATWIDALDRVLATRDAQKLDLPLTGHNYLFTTVTKLADAIEAKAEERMEAERKADRSHAGSAPISINQAISGVVDTTRKSIQPQAMEGLAARKMRAAVQARKASQGGQDA